MSKERGLNDPVRSEDEARREVMIERVRTWFAATHASDGFGILSQKGEEIARCDDQHTRDFLLRAARSFGPMYAVLMYVEWIASTDLPEGGTEDACPVCDNPRSSGHAKDCFLVAAKKLATGGK